MTANEQIRSASSIIRSVWLDESNRDQRLQRVLVAAGWQSWKRLVKKPLKIRLFNGLRFQAYPDCGCSSSALYSRIPNNPYTCLLRKFARGGTFIDVGANVGLVSTLVADRISHAILFEPNPAAAMRARENIRINHLGFEVHEIALSDQTGAIAFEDRGGVNTCNRVITGNSSISRTRVVPRTTLDEFLSQREATKAPVTIVKIDVEGHENWVLRGMHNLLTRERPVVMFEYLQRTNLAQTFEIFASVDYRVMTISAKADMMPATLETAPLQDLIAVPLSRPEMSNHVA